MKRLRKQFLVLMVLLFAVVGVNRSALAAGGIDGTITPEGVMPWKVVKTDDAGQHVRLSTDKELVRPVTATSFARHFNMSMDEFRQANREFTLAVCLDGGKPRRAPPIHGTIDRASNEIWTNCQRRDVWLILGSTYVMKRLEDAIPFQEQQDAIRAVASCGTKTCMGTEGQNLVTKYGSGTLAPVVERAPSTTAVSPPAIPQADVSIRHHMADLEIKNEELRGQVTALTGANNALRNDKAKLEAAAAAPVSAMPVSGSPHATNAKDVWASLGLVFIALLSICSAFYYLSGRNRARAELAKERTENALAAEEATSKETRIREFDLALRSKDAIIAQQDATIASHEARIASDGVKIEALQRIKENHLRTEKELEAAHASALQLKDAEIARLKATIATSEAEITAFLSHLRIRLQGDPLIRVGEDLDLTVEMSDMLAIVDQVDRSVMEAVKHLGEVVDGRGVQTRNRPFDMTRLDELVELVSKACAELQPYSTADADTLVHRVHDTVNDSTLAHLRARVDGLIEEKAALRSEKSELTGRLTGAEARVSELTASLVSAQEENSTLQAELQANRTMEAAGNQAMQDLDSIPPTSVFHPHAQSRVPEIVYALTRGDEGDADSDRPTALPSDRPMLPTPPPVATLQGDGGAERPSRSRTLVPGMFRAGSVRSEDRVDAFKALDLFNAFMADRAVLGIEDDSELDSLARLAMTAKHRRFQCVDTRGSNTIVGLFSLADQKFRDSLRASVPAV